MTRMSRRDIAGAYDRGDARIGASVAAAGPVLYPLPPPDALDAAYHPRCRLRPADSPGAPQSANHAGVAFQRGREARDALACAIRPVGLAAQRRAILRSA